MKDKSLSIRYFFYFFISLFFLILITNIFKTNEIKYSLDKYEKFVSKEYLKYYNEYKNSSELIYFNEFVKNKELIKTFKNINANNIETNKKEIYKHLKDNYLFYKTLDVSEINFYSSSSEFLLSMNETFSNRYNLEIVNEVIKNKNEIMGFKVVADDYYLIFAKPIFDENLNFLGVVNIEFDFSSLIKKIEFNSEFSYTKLVTNQIKLSENFYFNLSDSQKKLVFDNINKSNDFSLITQSNTIDFPLIFIPILKSFVNESNLYLVAYSKNEANDIAKIDRYFDFLFIIITFTIFIIFYLFYKLKYFKIQKLVINKKYQELYSQIDDYIIMAETDLQGIITYVTKPFCEISGYSKKELIGKNINLLKKFIYYHLCQVENWKISIQMMKKIENF